MLRRRYHVHCILYNLSAALLPSICLACLFERAERPHTRRLEGTHTLRASLPTPRGRVLRRWGLEYAVAIRPPPNTRFPHGPILVPKALTVTAYASDLA